MVCPDLAGHGHWNSRSGRCDALTGPDARLEFPKLLGEKPANERKFDHKACRNFLSRPRSPMQWTASNRGRDLLTPPSVWRARLGLTSPGPPIPRILHHAPHCPSLTRLQRSGQGGASCRRG